ncbi:MAG: hypothetical protein K2X90_00740 [Candidatus Babeliaceae bacterium]|nr:hypothetical protein [Candidatus Babeliaceae bacterium]
MIALAQAFLYSNAYKKLTVAPINALAMLSLATAFEKKGEASLEIYNALSQLDSQNSNSNPYEHDEMNRIKKAYLEYAVLKGNKRARKLFRQESIEIAHRDPLLESFSKVIQAEAAFCLANKLDPTDELAYMTRCLKSYAISLFKGTESTLPDPIKGLAIAMLLARKYAKIPYGQQLLINFAGRIHQSILPFNKEALYVYSTQYHGTFKSLNSFLNLIDVYEILGRPNDADALCNEMLEKYPHDSYAQSRAKKLKKDLAANRSPACVLL